MDVLIPYETYRMRHGRKGEALYLAIKDSIREGNLPFGTRLPASRELARQYDLSRGTVNGVYEALAAEGYLVSRVGQGTHVSWKRVADEPLLGRETSAALPMSDWGRRLSTLALRQPEGARSGQKPADEIRFELGTPDLRPFPFDQWNKLLYAEVREMGSPQHRELFAAQGHGELREAVAAYLNRSRGLAAGPEQVMIVNGSMQAIALICQLLLNPGELAAFEDPCYSGVRRAIVAAGGRLAPIPIGSGFLSQAERTAAKLLFVSPGRQFPTGTVLSLEERLRLLAWSERTGAVLVEDDYDSEFRHRGRALEPLKALDRTGHVIYIGSFSKVLPPAHRLGYVVLPEPLAEPFTKLRQLYEPHPSALLEQRAMARFMQSGHFERHLRRMKRIYAERFHRLKSELREQLGDCLRVVPSDCGLHLFAWWAGEAESWAAFRDGCRQSGVYWTETESYFAGAPLPSACFGFSHLTEPEITAGVVRMAQVWQGMKEHHEQGRGSSNC